jgi:hypothetical protein
MQKARRHPIKGLRPLVGAWFQVLFTPLFEVLFTFPSQYLFTIGLSVVFSLTRWCWWIQTGRLRPRLTQDTVHSLKLTNTGLSPSTAALPKAFSFVLTKLCQSYNPKTALTALVWAFSRSLATT